MDISLYHTIQPVAADAIALVSIRAMRVLSYAIEDVVLQGPSGAVLSVGFQRLSHFQFQEARYRRLAKVCAAIHLHAVPDLPPPAITGLTHTPLAEGSPLAREWFLVVNTPGFAAALIAVECDGPAGAPRSFQALFTAEESIIDEISLLLHTRADRHYEPPVVRDYQLRQMHLQRVLSRLIAHQQRPAPVSARAKMADELRELTRLIPCFADHPDWQRFLITTIQQRAATLPGE